ncbi:hypothetical protein E3P77_02914 [Wallemia ichthyophaga]|nr:hypothetical protein E3P77_02914 [Wallemia ichthyophaga]
MVELTIKTLQQKVFKIEIDLGATIATLKQLIHDNQGFAVDTQKLIFSGKILADDRSIESLDIKDKDFLVVMVSKPKPTPKKEEPATQAEGQVQAQAPEQPQTQTQPESQPQPSSSAPGNNLAMGSELETAVGNMVEMGFDRDLVMKAMRASFNNPERAVEYLMNGIPGGVGETEQPEQPEQSGQSGQSGQSQQAPLNLFDAARQQNTPATTQQPAQSQPSGLDSTAGGQPAQLAQLVQAAQENPALLQSLIQEIAQSNPTLAQLLTQNPQALVELLSGEGGDGEFEDSEGPGQVIHLTEEQGEAVSRLEALGFTREMSAQALLAFEGDENLAANYLFEHQDEIHNINPSQIQREELNKLLKDPTKPVELPDAPRKKEIAPAREMFAHVQGSSAGAGSGEFHVYKQSRRREYDRIQLMEEEKVEEANARDFEQRRLEREKLANDKTSKNRNRRNKRKLGKSDAKTRLSNDKDDSDFKKRRMVGDSGIGSDLADIPDKPDKTVSADIPTAESLDAEKQHPYILIDSLGDKSPKLWPAWKRWSLTVFTGVIAIASAFTSACTTGIAEDIMAEFNFSDDIDATLCLSLYMLGYVLGPIWGPASEAFGRDALAHTPAALYVCRFFAGFFGGCMIIVVGPLIGDMFTAKDKQLALAIYACCPYLGPSIAPIVSGFIHDSGVGWRWVFWVVTIFCASCALAALVLLPETYEPVLLTREAKRRRKAGDSNCVAPKELTSKGLADTASLIFSKPFIMLAREPMLAALSFYSSFVYGVQYLLFEAFQFVYSAERGGHDMSNGVRGLTFLPLSIGSALAALVTALFFNRRYVKKMEETGEKPPPEIRLEGACLGGVFGVVFFFWFGWTSYPWISPWSPIVASTLWGAAQCMVYLAQVSYINDCYSISAASALSGLVMCRSVFGAVFPLFANKMYGSIGPRWACTILGVVQIILAFVPWVLIWKGPAFRAKSKFGE